MVVQLIFECGLLVFHLPGGVASAAAAAVGDQRWRWCMQGPPMTDLFLFLFMGAFVQCSKDTCVSGSFQSMLCVCVGPCMYSITCLWYKHVVLPKKTSVLQTLSSPRQSALLQGLSAKENHPLHPRCHVELVAKGHGTTLGQRCDRRGIICLLRISILTNNFFYKYVSIVKGMMPPNSYGFVSLEHLQ
jgi:hypothetical protein